MSQQTPAGPLPVSRTGCGRALEDWALQHPLLEDRFRVHSLDLPGVGDSEALREPYSLSAVARSVVAFVDALGVAGPVHLAGNRWVARWLWPWRWRHRSGCARRGWPTMFDRDAR